ncbi:hypothetical protein ACWOFR_01210 [Carnobacterium gallinarum]|uniref:hypothetical protein n=1 Tax=Carnobacterium gallinarum TaxID=2749 RepID=UPI00055261FC|nr:hypothetical protein [Carnobacterium gallinarum]
MKYWFIRLSNVKYLSGVFVGLLLISIHIFLDMVPRTHYLDGINLLHIPSTAWIGNDFSGGYSMLFYFLLPLFSALGANLIVFEDKQDGYFLRFLQKRSITKYSLSTFSISFFSGFLISFIPLGLNLLIALALFPNIAPDALLNSNLGVSTSSTYFSQLFFSNPYLLIFFYMVMTGCLSALCSCVSATISLYTKNIYTAISSGFLIVLVMTILSYVLPTIVYSPVFILIELSPVQQLPHLSIVMAIYFIILCLSFYYFIKGVKKNGVI